MGFFDILFKSVKKNNPYAGIFKPCPNCKKKVNLGYERCPNCGVRIASMFRKKCPKCKTLNDLDAPICKNEKCKYDFSAEMALAHKKKYKCPICGYEADYFMISCPACGTRFG
ncbi:MAG: zinc ribbon domain-containing protein [Candidatus Micrarchaeia archaeon]